MITVKQEQIEGLNTLKDVELFMFDTETRVEEENPALYTFFKEGSKEALRSGGLEGEFGFRLGYLTTYALLQDAANAVTNS